MKRLIWLIPTILLVACIEKTFEEKLINDKKLREKVSYACIMKYNDLKDEHLMVLDEECKSLALIERPFCEQANKSELVTENCEDDGWLIKRPTAWKMMRPFLG